MSQHRHDDMIEAFAGPPDQVDVPVCRRIERPGVDDFLAGHAGNDIVATQLRRFVEWLSVAEGLGTSPEFLDRTLVQWPNPWPLFPRLRFCEYDPAMIGLADRFRYGNVSFAEKLTRTSLGRSSAAPGAVSVSRTRSSPLPLPSLETSFKSSPASCLLRNISMMVW